MGKLISDFQYTELSSANPAKKFEGLASGTFIPGNIGKPIVFSADKFPAIVENTKAAIESSRTESGELVGLPIDMKNHDHEGGAGWIVDAELSEDGNKILLTPNWTHDGAELIAENKSRFFSPSVDLAECVIAGGTLCNWPASRDKKQRFALKPIELTDSVFSLQDESLDERINNIRSAFNAIYQPEVGSWFWVREVYDTYLIADGADGMYRVDFTENADGTITFKPMGEWVKVKISYVEAAIKAFKTAIESVFNGLANQPDQSKPNQEKELNDMAEPKVTLADLAATPEGSAELNALVEAQTKQRVTELLAQEQRKANIAELVAKITGGSPETPKGLPVDKDELTAVLLSLPVETSDKLTAMLKKIQTTGLVDFSEKGHDGHGEQKSELLPEFKASLKSWVTAGKPIAEFFAINPEVGEMSAYNLSEFETKEK